ncbi:MAG: class I SAM-dependent methyltransferase, partial [Actinomycetota bacterium]|nr:class I SAM-dependent methyltransferase [Actinomycetota bacterium]
SNLESSWAGVVACVGLARARIWRLYMAGCANRFDQGALGIHQVLGVVTDHEGHSFMPPTRADWEPVEPAAER